MDILFAFYPFVFLFSFQTTDHEIFMKVLYTPLCQSQKKHLIVVHQHVDER